MPGTDRDLLRSSGCEMSRRRAPRIELGDRDLAVLGSVGRLRFMSGDQVARLHFAEGTPIGRQRRAQAALRRLTEDGYLHRLPRRVGGAGSGSARFVYHLGYRGQKLVWPDRAARTPGDSGLLFVAHSLAIAAVVVEMREAEQSGRVRALRLQMEPAVWRHYVGSSGRVLVLKPDLGVQLAVGSGRFVWFVEVDRATEGLKRIRTKASQYLDYWRSGREQERLGVFPRVLWSVPDQKRLEAIEQALGQLPDPAAGMFVVATADQTVRALLGQPTTNEEEVRNAEQQRT